MLARYEFCAATSRCILHGADREFDTRGNSSRSLVVPGSGVDNPAHPLINRLASSTRTEPRCIVCCLLDLRGLTFRNVSITHNATRHKQASTADNGGKLDRKTREADHAPLHLSKAIQPRTANTMSRPSRSNGSAVADEARPFQAPTFATASAACGGGVGKPLLAT